MKLPPPHADAPPPETAFSLDILLQLLRREKMTLLGSVLLGLALGLLFLIFFTTPRYSTTTTGMLDSNSAQIVDLASVVGSLAGDTSEITTELEVLRSRKLLEQVVDRMDLMQDPEFNPRLAPPGLLQGLLSQVKSWLPSSSFDLDPAQNDKVTLDAVTERLTQSLSVRNIPNSLVFSVTATTRNPLKSAELADAVVLTYIDDQLVLKTGGLDDASDWLSERVTALYQELQDAETELSAFNISTDLISPEQLTGMNYQLKDIRSRIAALETSRLGLETELAAQGPGAPAGLTDNIDRIRSQIDALQTSGDMLEEKLRHQSLEQIELNRITREVAAQQELYEYFLRRLRETTSMTGMQAPDSRILSRATINLFPSSPSVPTLLTIFAVLGLLTGAGLVLWRERQTRTFRTAEDLEKFTGRRVLGQVPMVPARARKDVIGYLADKPTSAAAEAIRNLRTSVLLTDTQRPPQIIGTTSAVPSEGKTTTALALAQNFIGLGQKVLLIEGDIRRRIFGEYLTVDEDGGLIAVMEGRIALQDAVVQYDKVKADILVAGTSTQNAADLFSSQGFERMLEEARKTYDTIIIDTAPVLLVPDARIIARHVDAMLFVVAWDSTSKEQVTAALGMFDGLGVQISGLVLNQVDPKGMKRYGHAGRYGAYAAYGSKYYTN
ncbi:polysaccharide biosynthesis tyrosine autokinase [Pseudooceanicola algae]|uniref:polysaccharide biosynthesis tyrosine autokinase n=1 Tax=Pseudooceanicola algae TaxID=1537215 RepID=UPI0018CA8693|nr:polysaccharide biosynthesis tyrosine autokinase [Pseudooceanicola algae]